jgi:hypothetical protein
MNLRTVLSLLPACALSILVTGSAVHAQFSALMDTMSAELHRAMSMLGKGGDGRLPPYYMSYSAVAKSKSASRVVRYLL